MHDELYKTLFAFPRMVEDLLRGFAARRLTREPDFSSLRKLSADHASDDRMLRHDVGMVAAISVMGYRSAMSSLAFGTFSAARALEAAGVERTQAEAIAGAIAAQAITRADLDPLATKAELRILQWVVGVQSAITLATFAIVASKLL